MGHFIVSARKYRPETFKSVIGQDPITATLKNAIKGDHLGHAYLFCGPRGVGKTTCARIFAKTINCSNLTSETEPCNLCESCLAFNESRSYNIHELDAASNNSVEGIRTLTEQVRIPPQIGKYSVYIIDEVHMLSQQAFNAFLKTLEEPPAHAIFILATTEKHKIIPTILSRCQIFDFNRIKVDDMVKYLCYIAGKEKINYETEALHIIAQKADGAMRDALSIFDQVVSFGGETIKYEHVIENLNILDYDYYFKLTDAFLTGDVSQVLLIFDEILNDGFDSQNFINGLASHFRDLLVSGNPETVKLLEVSDNLREKYVHQSSLCPTDFLYSALQICNETDLNYKMSRNQRLLVELALIKLANLNEEKKKPDRDEPVIKKDATPDNDTVINLPADHKKSGQNIKDNESNSTTQKSRDIKKNIVKTQAISIKNIVTGEISKEEEISSEIKYETEENNSEADITESPFSQEDLNSKWKEYADNINSDRPRISIMLRGREPVLGENYQVDLTLDNATQVEEFNNSIKSGILEYLKKELKNSFIRIQTHLEQKENGKKVLYTPEERFQYLSRKNPALNKLKQQFNLDFE